MKRFNHSFITVVSGLPRSGTSMMMQMLEAGGLAALTDRVRESDEDNLRGYYEFEPVKALKRDASWIDDARGKVVKVVYMLLKDLPREHDYRIVFMRRDLTEVIESQRAMLERRSEPGADLSARELAGLFERQLQKTDDWLNEQPNMCSIDVAYRDAIGAPQAAAAQVAEFLELPLDVEAMAAVVEPDLYRQRAK